MVPADIKLLERLERVAGGDDRSVAGCISAAVFCSVLPSYQLSVVALRLICVRRLGC
jgi:hypothetical protein